MPPKVSFAYGNTSNGNLEFITLETLSQSDNAVNVKMCVIGEEILQDVEDLMHWTDPTMPLKDLPASALRLREGLHAACLNLSPEEFWSLDSDARNTLRHPRYIPFFPSSNPPSIVIYLGPRRHEFNGSSHRIKASKSFLSGGIVQTGDTDLEDFEAWDESWEPHPGDVDPSSDVAPWPCTQWGWVSRQGAGTEQRAIFLSGAFVVWPIKRWTVGSEEQRRMIKRLRAFRTLTIYHELAHAYRFVVSLLFGVVKLS